MICFLVILYGGSVNFSQQENQDAKAPICE